MADLTILIHSRDGEAYAELLSPLREQGVQLVVAPEPGTLPAAGLKAAVALAEPDRLADLWRQLPALHWIQSTWAGVTPLLPAAEAGCIVTGVKDVFGAQMAEYTLGFLLNHVLGLPERRRAQQVRQWDPRPTGTLAGKTLGVLGTGSIGAEIARRAAAFHMTVIGCSLGGRPREPFETVYSVRALHDFLARCDALVTVLPDTPDSRGLLDAAALASLPAGAFLVNVGRGTVLEEEALAQALREGHLGGAALDVFREEPLPEDHAFWNTPGLHLTAHVAARSWPRDIAAIFLDNVAHYRAGESLRYRVDPERGY